MSSMEVFTRYTSTINIYNYLGVTDGRMHYVEMTLLTDLPYPVGDKYCWRILPIYDSYGIR